MAEAEAENLQVAGEPGPDAPRIDLAAVDKAIRGGLLEERHRLLECQKNRVYYEGDNDGEVPSRQAEDRLDYDQRPKQISFMTRKVIRGLTCHTYSPGPARTLGDLAASTWLERVYQDNGANALWHEADREATLQGTCAWQVAATGDPARPIRLHLWTAEELAVWCPADDVLCPQAVCTITQDGTDRVFTLYARDFVRVYRERREASLNRTVIQPDGPDQANPYGVLPFAWVHFERPTRKFWVPGVGKLVRKINARVDEKMSTLAESQRFYLNPMLFASGVPPGWRPKIAPGRFNLVPYRPGPNGSPAAEPKVWALQAPVDVAGAWTDIRSTAETGLSDLDIPLSAYRSEATSTQSGAALVTEQKPLLDYARARRLHYGEAEGDLVKLVLRIGGGYYDWAEAGLKAALLKEADDHHLTLTWPDDLRVPTMDAASVQAQDLEQGLTSRVKELMKERGFSREQAERELAEIVADEALYQQLQAQAGLSPAAASQDDPAAPGGGEGEADPDTGKPVAGYVREGDAVVPLRDDSTPGPASSPGVM